MSSIEIPNTFNAAGVFTNPNSFSAYPTPILSSSGIEPYDPTNSPSAIKGGVTRLSAGAYIVRQVEAIDFLEGVAIAQPGNSSNACSAILVPANPTAGLDDGKAVSVTTFARDTGAPADSAFQLVVLRFATGPRFADL